MIVYLFVFFVKQNTSYEMRIRDWSSDVCSSDLQNAEGHRPGGKEAAVGDALGIEEVFAVDIEAMQHRRRDDSRQQDRTEIERKVQLAVIDLPHEKCGPANEPQRHQIADAERQLDSHPRTRLQVFPASAESERSERSFHRELPLARPNDFPGPPSRSVALRTLSAFRSIIEC